MKTIKSILTGILVMSIMVSCSKDQNQDNLTEENLTEDVVGSYKGLLTNSLSQIDTSATATITYYNNYTVQIHCVGGGFDSTFLLELYQNGNYMMVCTTGNDYLKEYGRNKESNHHMMTNGSMMNWNEHLQEHNANEEHYGSFDTKNHSFDYEMRIDNASGKYSQHFVGTK